MVEFQDQRLISVSPAEVAKLYPMFMIHPALAASAVQTPGRFLSKNTFFVETLSHPRRVPAT